MGEKKSRKDISESSELIEEVSEISEEVSEIIEEVVTPPIESEPIKPYIDIDSFLRNAIHQYDLNRMQVVGFKAYMMGRHYQFDEQVFVDGLKKYLNIQ